jgi:hypothetical protein
MILWKTIESSKNSDDFRAYLKQYPNGIYATLARQRLEPSEGVSLADTMKYIQDKLGSNSLAVNYLVYMHDNANGTDWTVKNTVQVTNVRASVADCRIEYYWRQTRDGGRRTDGPWSISMKTARPIAMKALDQWIDTLNAAGGHPEWKARVDPPIFFVVVDWFPGEVGFQMYDESLATGLTKALVHAASLCDGGYKDPFK